MKVLLIVPPSYGLVRGSIPTFHLGLGYLAAVLNDAGHEVRVYDANCPRNPERKRLVAEEDLYTNMEAVLRDPTQPVWNEVEAVIREQNPDVVGISAKSLDLGIGLAISRVAKRIIPTCKVIFGGAAATTCPEMVLTDDSVDFVVRGEGEVTMLALLQALTTNDRSSLHAIDGISYRDSSGLVHTPDRSLIEDLDSLPLPARDLLLYVDRQPPVVRRAMMGDMVTSRGCPFGCTFCANKTIWGTRRVRERSPASIVEEMTLLRNKYGAERLILWDDQLTMNRRRAIELCTLLIGRGAPVPFITF